MAQRSQLLVILFVGTIFLVISLAGATPSGACGSNCGSGKTCCDGVCRDPASFYSDRANCGQCGNRCFDFERCCGTCTIVDRDSSNCGRCGNVCKGGRVCCKGRCRYPNSRYCGF